MTEDNISNYDSETLFNELEIYSKQSSDLKTDEELREEDQKVSEGLYPDIKVLFLLSYRNPTDLNSSVCRCYKTKDSNLFRVQGILKKKILDLFIFTEGGFWVIYTKNDKDSVKRFINTLVRDTRGLYYLDISSNVLLKYAQIYSNSRITGFTSKYSPVSEIRGFTDVTMRMWGGRALESIEKVRENFMATPSRIEFRFIISNPGPATVSINNKGYFALRKGQFYAFKKIIDDFVEHLKNNIDKVKRRVDLDIEKMFIKNFPIFNLKSGSTEAIEFKLPSFDFNGKDKEYVAKLLDFFTKDYTKTKLVGIVLRKEENQFVVQVYDEVAQSSYYVELMGNSLYMSPDKDTPISTVKRLGKLLQLSFDPKVQLEEIE